MTFTIEIPDCQLYYIEVYTLTRWVEVPIIAINPAAAQYAAGCIGVVGKCKNTSSIPEHVPEPKTSEYGGACPHCGYKLEYITSFEGAEPHEGAVTICISCGKWSFLTIGGGLRKPTGFEMIELAGSPGIIRMEQAWISMKAERARHERANRKGTSRRRGKRTT